MNKYRVTIDQDDIDDIIVEDDDMDYDGPETNIDDPEGVYHITANDADEAKEAARWLDSIGNPEYSDVSESEYI